MNKQEIFNTVATHLLTQKQQATNVSGVCQYRTRQSDGTTHKCAVGCLIPDKHYHSRIEGVTVRDPKVENVLRAAGVFPSGFEEEIFLFLESLQNIHDFSDPSIWHQKLQQLAARNGLSMPDIPN